MNNMHDIIFIFIIQHYEIIPIYHIYLKLFIKNILNMMEYLYLLFYSLLNNFSLEFL